VHACDRQTTDRQTTLRRNVYQQVGSLPLQDAIPPKTQTSSEWQTTDRQTTLQRHV